MMRNFNNHKKRYILVIFFIFLLVFVIFFKLGFFENNALKSALYWEQHGRTLIADSSKRVSSGTKAPEVTPLDSIIKFEEGKLPGGNSGNMYYIIIGSFTNSENATIAAKQYRSLG
jgi:hypothetical protein